MKYDQAPPSPSVLAPLTVAPVTSRPLLQTFIRFPWRIYRHYPAWVPPLLLEREQQFSQRHNPFLQHATLRLWIAWRGSTPVGTIAAYVDHLAPLEQRGCFGFFECLPDPAIATALLNTATRWVQQQGVPTLRGPFHFAADNQLGLLLDSYNQPPVLMTTYNPPYYCDLLEYAGFRKAVDWYAYEIDPVRLGMTPGSTTLPPRLHRAQQVAQRRSRVQIRSARLEQFRAELARAQQLYNHAWDANPEFVPMTPAEAQQLAQTMRPFVDADLIYFAEHEGQPVGISIALPDLNQVLHRLNGRLLPTGWWQLVHWRQHVDTLRFFALGVLPAYRRQGIESLLCAATLQAALHRGYRRAELSVVVESNLNMRRSAEAFGAQHTRTYRIYTSPPVPICARASTAEVQQE